MTICLLMRTGCRKNKIMTLRWERVDLDKAEMRIANENTRSRMGHLSQSAVRVLKTLQREPCNLFGFRCTEPETGMADTEGVWQPIRARRTLCRAYPRFSPFLHQAGAGAGREPDHEPQAVRTQVYEKCDGLRPSATGSGCRSQTPPGPSQVAFCLAPSLLARQSP